MRARFLSRHTATLIFTMGFIYGQTTQLDLRSQAKNVDFSRAASTRPFKTGTAMPPLCTVGDAFFKTDAPAGSNLYACTATNIWSLQSGGGNTVSSSGATLSSQLADLNVKSSSSALLTIGTGCSSSTPCNVSMNGNLFTYSSAASATLAGVTGSGTALVYVSSAGVITIQYPVIAGLSVTCTGCLALAQSVPALPVGALPLGAASFQSSGGTLSWTAIVDTRSFLSGGSAVSSVAPGPDGGVNVICSGSDCQTSVDPTYTATQSGNNDFTGNNRVGAGVEGFDNSIANELSVGTLDKKLAKLNAGAAIITSLTDSDGAIGIVLSGGGNTGTARVRFAGFATCTFDNTATQDHYVQISSLAAGQCHDAGAARPASGQIIGKVVTSGTGNQSVWLALDSNQSGGGTWLDAQAGVSVTTASTDTTVVSTAISSIPAGKCVRYHLFWTDLTPGRPMTYKVSYGSGVLTLAAGSSSIAGSAMGVVCNIPGSQTSQILAASAGSGAWSGASNVNATAAVDASAPQVLKFTAAGLDMVRADAWLVEVVK
jgi:hypothetical protein